MLRLGVAVAAVAAVLTAASIGQVRAAIENAMTCALTSPCLEWDNTGSGDAIKGVSTKGNAIHGQTKYKSAGKPSGRAGVLGEDLSTSGTLDSGVLGTSSTGAGVTGTSQSYNAVQGMSSISTGVYGQSAGAGGFGVAGRDISTTHSNSGGGVLADGGPADDGLHAFGNGTSANGVYAFSQSASSIVANQGSNDTSPLLLLQHTSGPANFVIEINGLPGSDVFHVDSSGAVKAAGQVTAGGNLFVNGAIDGGSGMTISSGLVALSAKAGASQALIVHSGTSGMGNAVLTIEDSGASPDFDVADDGNVYVPGGNLTVFGLVYTQGSCSVGCVVGGRLAKTVGEYAPAETEPTIEDNGEATLVDGVANVTMDPKFVNVIDPTSEYLVSVTPEGDCEGLFVASRGPKGFVVRELRRGHHTLSFEYRIVAKRVGVHAPRLPMIDARRVAAPQVHAQHGGRP